jgi:hypothetical protein
MIRSLPFLFAFLPLVALADGNDKFNELRDKAEPLSGLGPFLDRYIGECESSQGPECKQNATAFRKEANAKRFYMAVPEDAAVIAAGRIDSAHEQITLNVTPFFPAGGYALTSGSPRRTDAEGNPVMPLTYVKAKVPDGMDASSVARLIGMRGLKLELVFTPQDVWTLAKKEKKAGKMYGVKAKIEAMLVSVARTGEPLALWPSR